MNKVILKGNLVANPESREVGQNKTALTKFRVAVNDFKKTVYVDVETWEKTAKNCEQYLTKGSPILLEGRLNLDEWETDGKKRSRITVVASNVEFLGKLSAENEKETPEPSAATDSSANAGIGDDDDVPF